MKEYFRIITKIAKTPNKIWKDLLSLPSQPIAVLVGEVVLCDSSNVILSNFISICTFHNTDNVSHCLTKNHLARCFGILYGGACPNVPLNKQ